jgi:UDP:flavonoid glycosyltransferase YjiC (YdhE family)
MIGEGGIADLARRPTPGDVEGMARVLLAWELGGNSGHAVRLAHVAQTLARAGHAVTLAVQRPDSLRRWRTAPGCAALRQAPIWPGLLRHSGLPTLQGEAAWGDLLAGMGMTDSGVLEYLLRCWDGLLADTRAEVLVADFAPAAMLAARGRLPVLAVGTGFTVPAHGGARFALLRPGATRALIAEEQLLQVVNRALWRLGRAPLARLPEIAAADHACPATFAELDPYRAERAAPPLPPFLSGDPGEAGEGEEVFAYFTVTDPRSEALMRALGRVAARGVPVSAWMPGLPAHEAKALLGAGVELHPAPLTPAAIAARARLILGTGGLGSVSSALAAGLPLALLPLDLEKRLTAEAVAGMGAGAVLRAEGQGDAEALAGQILACARDEASRARARTLAPGFRARLGDPAAQVAGLIARL